MDFNDIIPFVDYFINYCTSDEAKEFIAESLKIRKKKDTGEKLLIVQYLICQRPIKNN